MKCEHTPTPWFLMNSHKAGFLNVYGTHETGSAVDGVAADFVCEIGPGARNDGVVNSTAQFIVRACNSHAELIRVLKEALTHNGVEHDTTLKEMIVSALKTAGEI